MRLDAELVRRGLAKSREHASQLVADGRVTVRGTVATKPATAVETSDAVVVKDLANDPNWASRGAHKLIGALEGFKIDPSGRRCLDAGASTGKLSNLVLQPNPLTKGVRASFELDPSGANLVELRLRLLRANRPITETWLYRWTAS